MPNKTTDQPENWLQNHGDMLYRYALIRVRSEPVAEDLVQETLLAGLSSFKNFNGQSTVRTWLTGILKHKIIDHYRKNKNQNISLTDENTDEQLIAHQFNQQGHWKINLINWHSPEQNINDQQFWEAFRFCLSRLPQNMADLFLLRTLEGMSSEDCCKVLGFTSTNQLWTTLSRARMKLRSCLDNQWFNI